MWGESKSAKMDCSGFLTPCFVNNGYVTSESIFSPMHAHQEAITGHELLCVGGIYQLHLESGGTLLLSHGCIC